jgi:hypothetical protein
LCVDFKMRKMEKQIETGLEKSGEGDREMAKIIIIHDQSRVILRRCRDSWLTESVKSRAPRSI